MYTSKSVENSILITFVLSHIIDTKVKITKLPSILVIYLYNKVIQIEIYKGPPRFIPKLVV